jgi:hypothetical protein
VVALRGVEVSGDGADEGERKEGAQGAEILAAECMEG